MPTFVVEKLQTMKVTRIIIGIVIVAILIAAAVFVHRDKSKIHDLPEILKAGRISVVTDSSSVGFSIKDDSIFGFQYELIKAFADTLGVELVVSEHNDMKTCVDGLLKGDYDIIASFMPVTTEWKSDVLFTNPFFTSRQVLVQQDVKDSAQTFINKISDLANKTICVPENSPFKMRIEHLSDEIAMPIKISEVKGKSPEQLISMVSSGKIKYTICDEQFVTKIKMQYPNLDVSLPIGFEQHQAWAVHTKSTKLLSELNDFLTDFVGSTAYWKIYRKYY